MRRVRIWSGFRERQLSGICQRHGTEVLRNNLQCQSRDSRSSLSTLTALHSKEKCITLEWNLQWRWQLYSSRRHLATQKGSASSPLNEDHPITTVESSSSDESSSLLMMESFTDKKVSYDEQLKAYSSQGDSRLYLLCAEKLISSLHRPHNQKKYSHYMTTEFFEHLMTLVTTLNTTEMTNADTNANANGNTNGNMSSVLGTSRDKIAEYYRIMTTELNIIPNKEILYLVIPALVHQKKISDGIHLLKKEIFRKISYLPKNQTESNQLFLSFFEEYGQENNLQSALEFYNLLLEQESIHSTQLLTDEIYCALLQMMTQGSNPLTENKYEIIEHWISHYRQQSLNSSADSKPRGHYEYFANETFEKSLQHYLDHCCLKNRGLSLYGTYSSGYQFCDLLLSNRIPAYLPILDYLSWLIDNMPVRLQSFVKLVFRYETNDILLFEVTPISFPSHIGAENLSEVFRKGTR